jgi:ribosomal protein S18 acetylase RimI-like enzyme
MLLLTVIFAVCIVLVGGLRGKAYIKSGLNHFSRLFLQSEVVENSLSNSAIFRSASQVWDIGLLTEDDLESAVDLSMECFYVPRVNIKLDNMNPLEKKIWGGVFGVFNRVEESDQRLSHMIGYRSRAGNRISKPNLDPNSDSFLLAARTRGSSHLAALVEVSIEPVDGKLGAPWKFPFRPEPKDTDEPYLCNLCVARANRRKGLGRIMCAICEDIVRDLWDKQIMYLHVEKRNLAAQALYASMGYEAAQSPLSAIDAKIAGLENISYYCKRLEGNESREEDPIAADLGLSWRDLAIMRNEMLASAQHRT